MVVEFNFPAPDGIKEIVIKPTRYQQQFLRENSLQLAYLETAQQWFMPVAQEIITHQKSATRPLVIGINGCQGSGKSTLADYLTMELTQAGLTTVNMSLDDFYFSSSDRKELAQNIHPMLATRGVPGTHNVALLSKTLKALLDKKEAIIPRFNKATDNPLPKQDWDVVTAPVDIIILEGWCWGTPAQATQQLQPPCNDLEQQEDPRAIWRSYVNQQVQSDYQPLYDLTDIQLMLHAPSFDCVKQWRIEQEEKLRNKLSDSDVQSGLMDEQQIERFISYFQRLTEQSFLELPSSSHFVWQLNSDRRILSLKRNKEINI